MKYAKWAPTILVAQHKELADQVALQARWIAEHKAKLPAMTEQQWSASGLCHDWSSCVGQILSKEAFLREMNEMAAETTRMAGWFERLVSDERAREIWDTIRRHPVLMEGSELQDGNHERLYANYCWVTVKSTAKMLRHTAAEKRDHLNSIASKAKELKRLFLASPYFNDTHFIKQVASWDAPDYLQGLILSPYRKNDLTPEGKTTISQQFTRLYESLTLETILDNLADRAIAKSKVSPKVKKVRSANAERNYFVRSIYEYHLQQYGKPLWNMLTATTNVMFDLSDSESLTPNDVRPLVR